MEKREYVQIHYNPDDLDDVFVDKEVSQSQPDLKQDFSEDAEDMSVHFADDVRRMLNPDPDAKAAGTKESDTSDTTKESMEGEQPSDSSEEREQETGSQSSAEGTKKETEPQSSDEGTKKETGGQAEPETEEKQQSVNSETTEAEEQSASGQEAEPKGESKIKSVKTEEQLEGIAKEIKSINYAVRRLEKKFETEILNSETRDSTVKTIYKELNDYKAGLVEKALKNVLYDFADLREMVLSQVKYIREKKQQDSISLEEFETYADDIADILEKYDVAIYKGELGVENVAVRQKIVRKVETEDDSLVKTVAESLSYGYEYNNKILYPEKISIYVKKK